MMKLKVFAGVCAVACLPVLANDVYFQNATIEDAYITCWDGKKQVSHVNVNAQTHDKSMGSVTINPDKLIARRSTRLDCAVTTDMNTKNLIRGISFIREKHNSKVFTQSNCASNAFYLGCGGTLDHITINILPRH